MYRSINQIRRCRIEAIYFRNLPYLFQTALHISFKKTRSWTENNASKVYSFYKTLNITQFSLYKHPNTNTKLEFQVDIVERYKIKNPLLNKFLQTFLPFIWIGSRFVYPAMCLRKTLNCHQGFYFKYISYFILVTLSIKFKSNLF